MKLKNKAILIITFLLLFLMSCSKNKPASTDVTEVENTKIPATTNVIVPEVFVPYEKQEETRDKTETEPEYKNTDAQNSGIDRPDTVKVPETNKNSQRDDLQEKDNSHEQPAAPKIYNISSAYQLLNIKNDLNGIYNILNDIDLGGIEWTPVGSEDAPFTGTINGNGHTVSNFKINTLDSHGYAGFIGYNCGIVRSLNFSFADASINLAGVSCGRIGIIAGVNKGEIYDCALNSILYVYGQAYENKGSYYIGSVCGINKGTISNLSASGNISADISCNNPNFSNVYIGGICGILESRIYNSEVNFDISVKILSLSNPQGVNLFVGGALGYSDSSVSQVNSSTARGKVIVAGNSMTTAGGFAGLYKNSSINDCTAENPEISILNSAKTEGKFVGLYDSATVFNNCSYLDSPKEQSMQEKQMRDTVINYMYSMADVEWTPEKDMEFICNTHNHNINIFWKAGAGYKGIPYSHHIGNLSDFKALINNGVLNVPEIWAFPSQWSNTFGSACVFGNDSAYAVLSSWSLISTDIKSNGIELKGTLNDRSNGAFPVGNYNPDVSDYTDVIISQNTGRVIFDSYAAAMPGDALARHLSTGERHTKMITSVPVVYRYQDGTVNPYKSYLLITEQTGAMLNNSTWRVNAKYSFSELLNEGYVPFTCKELFNSENKPLSVSISEAMTGKDYVNRGIVTSNYYIREVYCSVTDSTGETLQGKTMYPYYTKSYNLAVFDTFITTRSLPAGTYIYTVKVLAGTEFVTVKTFNFDVY